MTLTDKQRFRHTCWMGMEFDIHRYLMANAEGRQDGAEKAFNHIRLCCFMISAYTLDPKDAVNSSHPLFKAVHTGTQVLTDFLDDEIGFPVRGEPKYDELAVKFFDRFFVLSIKAMKEALPCIG